MLADQADLGVVLHGVERVAVLQFVAVGVVDEDVAVGHVVHEERPEQVANDDGLGGILAALDDAVEGLERGRLRVVRGPVVLADQVGLVDGLD